MKYKIEKGDKFKCVKTFKMEGGEKAYVKGNIYISEKKNCITDELMDTNHNMQDLEDFFEHFKLVYNE